MRARAARRAARSARSAAAMNDATGPLVSAVVVSFKGADVIAECLDSLFAQSYAALEIILIDNSANGDVGTAIQSRYGARLRIIANGRNEGFARGCNQGMRVARGDWIFLLNDDAVADAQAIAELMQFAAARPEVGMLACRVVPY